MPGTAETIVDILRWLQTQPHLRPPQLLRPLKGGQVAEVPLLPGIYESPRYGHTDGTPWLVVNDDALGAAQKLPDRVVDCVVTSPPYYWQRDYGVDGQIGHEDTVEEYLERLSAVFRELLRALKPTGTAFIVIGDTYYSGRGQPRGGDSKQIWRGVARQKYRAVDRPGFGLPRKSLLGVPWRLALALQADGWVLRSSVIWRKPKSLAEPSVRDRPWTTTETIFLLSRASNYYFDRSGLEGQEDVWDIPAPNATRRYRHAAPYPKTLVNRCLAAGCPQAGLVLDPFAGSGTTLAVAAERGLPSIGFDLNPHFCGLAEQRLKKLTAKPGKP